MDENLLGYLIKALDEDSLREVEVQLLQSPEMHQRLEQLKRGLDQLMLDGVDPEPPPDLFIRTLARVAEYKCRQLPQAPRPTPAQIPAGGRVWWRRADVLVAAMLFLAIMGLGVPGVNTFWFQYKNDACRNNLHLFHQALCAYSDLHHKDFPKVEAQPPDNIAGIYVPILYDAGVLPGDITIDCPASGTRLPSRRPLRELEDLQRRQPEEFRKLAVDLGGCYAYSLGYFEVIDGQIRHYGLRSDSGDALPIMADKPPMIGGIGLPTGNSPNHGGHGQNVLFIGGNVRFCTVRTVGINSDDIYTNKKDRTAAGCGILDTVLGRSEACPYPSQDD